MAILAHFFSHLKTAVTLKVIGTMASFYESKVLHEILILTLNIFL